MSFLSRTSQAQPAFKDAIVSPLFESQLAKPNPSTNTNLSNTPSTSTVPVVIDDTIKRSGCKCRQGKDLYHGELFLNTNAMPSVVSTPTTQVFPPL